MCEQCMTNARMIDSVKNRILPGWFLCKARRNYGKIKRGYYGLGLVNDPILWIPFRPIPDPLEGMTDKEVDNASKRLWSQWEKFEGQERKVNMNLPIEIGYELYEACVKAGYRRRKHGSNVGLWLLDHIARYINKHEHKKNRKSMRGKSGVIFRHQSKND